MNFKLTKKMSLETWVSSVSRNCMLNQKHFSKWDECKMLMLKMQHQKETFGKQNEEKKNCIQKLNSEPYQSQNTLRRHQKVSRYEWYYFKRKIKLQKIETLLSYLK